MQRVLKFSLVYKMAQTLPALEGRKDIGVVDGVEYSVDMHAFLKVDDLGFDSELDVELDDAVPTLALELKLSQALEPTNGSMANPRTRFFDIRYTKEAATIVLNERSGSRDRRVTDLLFGVHLFASVRPLNSCPPEGPEALQACSLFQGTKAWLDPRLEPAEIIPALPWTRSAVLVIEQAFFVRRVRLFS